MIRVKSVIKSIIKSLTGIRNINNHLFINNFSKNPIIVDLGACKGGFSKAVSQKYASSKMILIEPNPYLIPELRSTFAGKGNIKIYNACIGSRSSDNAKFYLDSNPEASSLNESFVCGAKNGAKVTVKMISLADVFSIFNLREIELLKMDIEGEEWNVLGHFSREEFKKIHQISVEFHDFKNSLLKEKTKKCIEKLQKYGYSFIHQKVSSEYGTPYMNCLFMIEKS